MAECRIALLGIKTSSLAVKFLPSICEDPTNKYKKQVVVDGMPVQLIISNTAGTEGFSSLRERLYISNIHGFVLVYSITNVQSFNDTQNLRNQILRVRNDSNKDTLPLVLVGSQCHKEYKRVVSRYQGEELAMKWGCSFFEASAKTGRNVDEIFMDVAHQILEKNKSLRKLAICMVCVNF